MANNNDRTVILIVPIHFGKYDNDHGDRTDPLRQVYEIRNNIVNETTSSTSSIGTIE